MNNLSCLVALCLAAFATASVSRATIEVMDNSVYVDVPSAESDVFFTKATEPWASVGSILSTLTRIDDTKADRTDVDDVRNPKADASQVEALSDQLASAQSDITALSALANAAIAKMETDLNAALTAEQNARAELASTAGTIAKDLNAERAARVDLSNMVAAALKDIEANKADATELDSVSASLGDQLGSVRGDITNILSTKADKTAVDSTYARKSDLSTFGSLVGEMVKCYNNAGKFDLASQACTVTTPAPSTTRSPMSSCVNGYIYFDPAGGNNYRHWFTAASLGMSCNQVCAPRGGVNTAGAIHVGNQVGRACWPNKASGSNWEPIECSSTDNNTNWGANGGTPDPNWTFGACYVNCACNNA